MPFRTSTTPFLPEAAIQEVIRHRLVLPEGAPLQRELATLCSSSGGVPIELWVRHYKPNLRERVAARGLLTLSRLCGLVSMHRPGDPNEVSQHYSLLLHE